MEYNYEDGYGHDVNDRGYDINGIYRGQPIPKKKKKPNVTATGGGGLIGLIVVVFIIYKVLEFLEKNWVSVIAILSVIILCIIFCNIIKRKLTEAGLAIFIAILMSLGLIGGIIYLGPMQNDGNFNRWQNKTIATKQTAPAAEITAKVTSDVNFRAGPSGNSEVLKILTKGTIVTITGESSGDWTPVEHDNVKGWVSSQYIE